VSLPLRALANVDGRVRTGPIPKGTPINLLANLEPDFKQLVVLKVKITKALAEIHALNLSPEAATADRNLPNRSTQTEQR
jgi:hypothetical protein